MISGWLLKIALAVAIAGFIIIEVGSPLILRINLDSNAHETADDAAQELTNTHDPDRARGVAEHDAEVGGAKLDKFDIDAQGVVRVTLFKQAKSYVLHNFKQTRGWYDVRASASAASK